MNFKPVPTWKVVLAFLLDLYAAFYFFGCLIAWWTDKLEIGFFNFSFDLEGVSALVLYSLILAYFIVMNKFFNGTFGRKIFGVSHLFVESLRSDENNDESKKPNEA